MPAREWLNEVDQPPRLAPPGTYTRYLHPGVKKCFRVRGHPDICRPGGM